MKVLKVIYAPNPVFKSIAEQITIIDDEIKQTAEAMLETMKLEHAVGLGANMLGVGKRIIVLAQMDPLVPNPSVMLNPEIIEFSEDSVEYEEASLSFPGISAVIKRPSKIKVKYLDLENNLQTIDADNFLARVIQHEIDYLNGKVYLDYLSRIKRDMLINKMLKFIKNNPPHIHGEHCKH